MQNPRRKEPQHDDAVEGPEPRPAQDDEQEAFPAELWIDRDYPIQPGIPG